MKIAAFVALLVFAYAYGPTAWLGLAGWYGWTIGRAQ